MGTTASSVDLMWSPSDDNIGCVDHYIIYRETEGSILRKRLQHPIQLLIWIKICSLILLINM